METQKSNGLNLRTWERRKRWSEFGRTGMEKLGNLEKLGMEGLPKAETQVLAQRTGGENERLKGRGERPVAQRWLGLPEEMFASLVFGLLVSRHTISCPSVPFLK
jgi:hypothetical protein